MRSSNTSENDDIQIFLERYIDSNGMIQSTALSDMWTSVVAAIGANLLAIPTAVIAFKDISEFWPEGKLVLVLMSIICLGGLLALYVMLNNVRIWRRYGAVSLFLDPLPGRIGGQVAGKVLLVENCGNIDFKIVLSCIQATKKKVTSDSIGRVGSTIVEKKVLWGRETECSCSLDAGRLTLHFDFDVPKGLPKSKKPSSDYDYWQIRVESKEDDYPLYLKYTIPVL